MRALGHRPHSETGDAAPDRHRGHAAAAHHDRRFRGHVRRLDDRRSVPRALQPSNTGPRCGRRWNGTTWRRGCSSRSFSPSSSRWSAASTACAPRAARKAWAAPPPRRWWRPTVLIFILDLLITKIFVSQVVTDGRRTHAYRFCEFEHVTVAVRRRRRRWRTSRSRRSRANRASFWARRAAARRCCSRPRWALIKPDRGKVFAFGQDITHACAKRELFDIRSKIGMLFQESALFDSLTIEENVAYPLLNQKSIQCPPERGAAAGGGGAGVRGTGRHAGEVSERAFGRHAAARRDRARGGDRAAAVLYDSPTAGLDPITAHTIMALLIKERDVSQTTTLMVTHRYQDGNLMANFRYNSEQGRLEPARNGARAATRRPRSWCCGKAGWSSKATRTDWKPPRIPIFASS